MRNKFYNLLLLCFSLILLACESNSNELKLAESKVDDFYNFEKAGNYRSIDLLMSYQFYQVTPYNKFVNFLKVKKEVMGNFKSKKLIASKITKITNSNNRILLDYEVWYVKKKTVERFIFEIDDNDYRILNYVIE
ncbi:hypothetical protein [Flavobacterium chilense]|uniref:Lipoprotein n=1 Tax=Flavobacterium chilense TaxID=946677 RepID=A0A1M7N1N0_9FLAO|nr:hypothetical protein [Flavobacterium chilense]SHM97253.1 hypothetical protein SAMN05444484_11726 [Flavobacterium chilense]